MPPHRNRNNNNNYNNNRVILNVAEKPLVARALESAFGRFQDSQEGPARREAAQIFIHNNVRFPDIFTQGTGGEGRNQPPGPLASHTTWFPVVVAITLTKLKAVLDMSNDGTLCFSPRQ